VDVRAAMRTTGSVRYFDPADIGDDVLLDAIESARFGPSGGNRQPLRFIVVRDPTTKRALADLYLPLWKADLAAYLDGGMRTGSTLGPAVQAADDFAEHLHEVPVMLVVCALLEDLHPQTRGVEGPNMIAGASVYPIVQNVCLALRAEGVATTITTLICDREAEAGKLLGLPDDVVCACHVAVGRPAYGFPRRLTRLPVQRLVSFERYSPPPS
jgi:nitroreductase